MTRGSRSEPSAIGPHLEISPARTRSETQIIASLTVDLGLTCCNDWLPVEKNAVLNLDLSDDRPNYFKPSAFFVASVSCSAATFALWAWARSLERTGTSLRSWFLAFCRLYRTMLSNPSRIVVIRC